MATMCGLNPGKLPLLFANHRGGFFYVYFE